MTKKTTHWIWDGYYPGAGHAFAEEQKGLSAEQQHAILVGRRLSEPLPEVRVTALAEGDLPDAMASAFYPLFVTDALKAAIEDQAPGAAQFLAARVPGAKGGWWALNATAHVAAMDRGQSDFEGEPGAVSRVRRLVLKPIPEDAPALFHLEEVPQLLLVSDALRRALEAAGDAPGEFQAPEDWQLGVFDDDE